MWFESKTQEQRKEWSYCLLWLISKSFLELLFWKSICTVVFVCWPLRPQKEGHRRTGLCQHKDNVEMLLFMLMGSPVYWPPDWDNEMVEEKDGMRKRRGDRMGGWGEVICLEHSGLSAIWWRWNEVLKIDNVLDMSSAKIWPHRPRPEGVRLRHVTNIILDSPNLQSVSQNQLKWPANPKRDKSVWKSNKLAWGDGH